MGRIVNQDSLTKAKRTAECIAHRNMLIGRALQMKLAEDKANRREHQRADLIRVKEGNINE